MSKGFTRREFTALAAGGIGWSVINPASFARAADQPLEKVSLAIVPLASSGAVLIAQGKGWFREEGIDLSLKTFNAAGPVPVAVVSGDADLGVTGLTAGFYNMAGQGAIKIIAGQSREEKGFELNGFIASDATWKAGARQFPELVGRRIGITTFGSTVHYSILLAAKKYKIDPSRFTLVPLQSIANMVAAFKGGQVDAIVSPVNTFRQMQSEGFGKLIAWVGDIAPWQLGGLFASPKIIANRRPAVEKFMKAYVRGCAAYNAAFNQRSADGKPVKGNNYDEYLLLLSKVIGQKPELVATGLPYVDPKAEFDSADIAQQIAIWKAAKQVAQNVSADAVIDRSFL